VKIVVAPDSFKESLSAAGVAQAIAAGVRQAAPKARLCCIPMSDGGEGTVDAVLAATPGGQRRRSLVRGALGEKRAACWGWLPDATAVIEMAAAAGLEHSAPEQREPLRASSYGVGELLRAALDAGAKRLILGLGGSACNDAGAGMLRALRPSSLRKASPQETGDGAGPARQHRRQRPGSSAARHGYRYCL